MKKLLLFAGIVLFYVALVSSAVHADVDRVIQIDSTLGSRLQSFQIRSQAVATKEEVIELYRTEGPEVARAFRDTAKDYQTEADQTKNKDLKAAISELASVSEKLAELLEKALTIQEDDAFISALIDFEDGLDDYQSAIDEFNNFIRKNPEASGDDTAIFYFGLMVASALPAIGSLIFALRAETISEVGKVRRQKRLSIFYAALLMLGGAVVTYFGYKYAVSKEDGGEYFIFYGPILFGFVYFIRNAVEYRKWSATVANNGGNLPQAPVVPKTSTT